MWGFLSLDNIAKVPSQSLEAYGVVLVLTQPSQLALLSRRSILITSLSSITLWRAYDERFAYQGTRGDSRKRAAPIRGIGSCVACTDAI